MKSKLLIFILIGVILIIIGIFSGDLNFTAKTATYGNYDVPNTQSWIIKMEPGIADYASKIVYGEFNRKPLIIISILFVVMLLISIVHNKKDFIWRKISQWSFFVIARLGVLRVAGICPIKRTELGTFPFLNCQSCEMATGACPVGMIQWALIEKRLPYYALGVITLFGAVLGRSVCGWMCPFGFFLDAMERIFHIKLLRNRMKISPNFRYLKYFIMIFILTAIVWAAPLFCIYICQAGNIYGYMPYYVTHGLEGFKKAMSGELISRIFIFHMASSVILFLGIITINGRWFCRYLCPLGAFLGLFNPVSLIQMDHDSKRCNGCNRCLRECPMQCDLSTGKFIDISGCIRCGKCQKVCGLGARKLKITNFKEEQNEN